ncbi:hypothetical protein GYM68_09025 [Lactobacillus panisapium]|uniref:hypothetical protein n=1 Tax=Lactobacillus panisapium TaxID=2012495 RepID=UPI001C69D697|nr:hypothetical protein [Lactobacillus panisapium]QYN59371.1 hypothetical protein GYM68_09025 [Lactobacillus panisapium]
MDFLRKTRSFIRFYFDLSLDNKFTFVFTLLFPIAYLLITYSRVKSMNSNQQMINLIGMIAYIIVDTALNCVTLRIFATRDSGYIKAYYFASGSKWAIYWANLIVQLLTVVLENLFFIIFSMILYGIFSIKLLILLVVLTIITFPFVSLGFNFIFLLPFRESSLSILSTTLLLGFLLIFTTTFPNNLNLLALLNPYTLIGALLKDMLAPSMVLTINIILVILIYSFIGFVGYQFFDLQNRGRKN